MLLNFYAFCRLLFSPQKSSLFSKICFMNTTRVSNSLNPDQTGQFVGPDLGPNCLQRLSADDTCRESIKGGVAFGIVNCTVFHIVFIFSGC